MDFAPIDSALSCQRPFGLSSFSSSPLFLFLLSSSISFSSCPSSLFLFLPPPPVFWNRVSRCNPGWPGVHHLPDSPSQELGLQMWAIGPGTLFHSPPPHFSHLLIYRRNRYNPNPVSIPLPTVSPLQGPASQATLGGSRDMPRSTLPCPLKAAAYTI